MTLPEFTEWPPIPQRSAPEADFDAKMYALFQHFAVTHRDEMVAFVDFLKTTSTIIGAALNGTTIGLDTPAAGKFTSLEADSFGGLGVQESVTDETAGRLMINGAHGLGSKDSSAITVSDGHADLPTGFYGGGGGGAVNFPPNANYRPFLNLNRRIGPDQYRQVRIFFGAENAPVIRFSDDKGVTWQEGTTVFGTRNILGAVSQDGGIPTGAVIERGSNGNGEYVRYADGTQICTASVLIDYDTAGSPLKAVWTLPATFVSRPTIGVTPMHSSDGAAPAGANWVGGAACTPYTRTTAGHAVTIYASRSSPWASGDAVAAHCIAIGRWF